MQHITLVAAVADAAFSRELRLLIALQDDINLLGAPVDAAQMLRAIDNLRPDVLLLDTTLTDANGFPDEAIFAAIRHASANTKTLLVGDDRHGGGAAAALRRGARGCISYQVRPDECLRAIRAVSLGEVWVGRKELANVIDDLLTRSASPSLDGAARADCLSQREAEIVDAVKLGLTNKEIGRKLRISDTTVKTHLERIFQKLHVSRRVQVVIAARLPRQESKPRIDQSRAESESLATAAVAKTG
jgi:DNA-binding NarL/FixJ family response regulator